MTIDLRCYGEVAAALADSAPALDLSSVMGTLRWYGRVWDGIAGDLGFSREMAAARAEARLGGEPIAELGRAGILAFDRALARAGARTSGEITEGHARVMESALTEIVAQASLRGEVWHASLDATSLRGGACVDTGDGRSRRAFYADTAPGFFGEGWSGPPPQAESACGWQTPVSLYLGTFPWVYSTRLGAGGPGMRWAAGSSRPATIAFAAMASLMEPAMNLRQDARQVAAIAEHFVRVTAPLVRRVPVFSARTRSAGQLYAREGRLYVHQGSLHVAHLEAARGAVRASAYNYILDRLACFFAVRRATLAAVEVLPPAAWEAAARSQDPCLRAHIREVRGAA